MRNIIFTLILFFSFCTAGIAQQSTFTDTRDKQVYKTVTINGTIWMAQNLRFETENSKELRTKKDKYSLSFKGGFGGAPKCGTTDEFGKKAITCEHMKVVGRYYDAEDAMEACPEGWHLATLDEWQELFQYISDTHGPFFDKKSQNQDLYQDRATYLKSEQWNVTTEAEDPLGF